MPKTYFNGWFVKQNNCLFWKRFNIQRQIKEKLVKKC